MAPLKSQKKNSPYPIVSQAKRVLQLIRDRVDQELRPKGVTAAQLHILGALDREPGLSGAHLARALMVTPQTTQVLLRTVEANGWIRRTHHPENERILLSTLTPAGKHILARSRTVITRVYGEMLEGLAPNEITALEELLGRCVGNLDR
jgi:DNA-binding MarR family transcriptional regulator